MKTESISYKVGDATVTANVIYLPATLIKRTSEGKTKGKGTIFYRYEVQATMPDGSTQTADANLWKGSYDKHTDKFAEGSNVTLEVQTDGEFKGRCKIQLPKSRSLNLDAFLGTTADVEEEEEVEVEA